MYSSRTLSDARTETYANRSLLGTMHGRQPARILIVDVVPPFWANTCNSLCEALENFFSLACSLGGPCRIPLLSVYAAKSQHECLLPFVQMKGSFQRLQSCVSELRAVPKEGSVHPRSECLKRAVMDGLQQFKQYSRLLGSGGSLSGCAVEITVLTGQPGRQVVRGLEAGLKDADLVSLRRLQVIQLSKDDLLESMDMKWISHSSEEGSPEVCVKCDVLERLLNPDLLPTTGRDANTAFKVAAGHATTLWKLKVIKAVKADGVCESVLYGLPLIFRPTCCWKLDWDELEANQQNFQALCHCLLKKDLVLLAKNEPQTVGPSWSVSIQAYYIIVPSSSFTLMAKAVAARELLLPCDFPAMAEELPEVAISKMESVLSSLEMEPTYNPLHMRTNIYKHLRGLLTRAPPCRQQGPSPAPLREQRPQPKQPSRAAVNKARATVAPLPMIQAPPQTPCKGYGPKVLTKEPCDLSLFSDDDDEFLDGL